MKESTNLKQPKVFKLAFLTALCERFGFYVLSFVFVLYAKAVFNMSDHEAFILFAVFTAFTYLTPALGGYLADNIFGIRRAIILGLLCEAISLNLLAFNGRLLFHAALGFMIIGTGFFKTAPTDLLARCYEEKDPRIDSGFTIFYMAINIGSFSSPLVAGFLQRYLGWHMAFLVGAIIIYVGLILYFLFRKSARECDASVGKVKMLSKRWMYIFAGSIGGIWVCSFLLQHLTIANIFFYSATLLVLLYFFFEIIRSPKLEKYKIIACLVLIFMGTAFFILYFQVYTSIDLYIDRVINHKVFGFHIPTTAYMSLNGFWILALSPVLAKLYMVLEKYGKNPAVTTKFPLGILIVSICFFTLKISTLFVDPHLEVSSFWIVLAFFLYSLGELLISALGVAMVTHIAPKRLYGVMMGAWFLIATSLASSLSGVFATIAEIPKGMHDMHVIINIYGKAFFDMGIFGLAAGVIAFLIAPYIKRIAQLD